MPVGFITYIVGLLSEVGQLDCGFGLRCGKLVRSRWRGSLKRVDESEDHVRTICPRGQDPRRVTLDGREFVESCG